MASSTPNIGLTLPVGTEKVSRQIVNQNMTKIDEKVGPVPNGQDLQSQVTSLSSNINFPNGAKHIRGRFTTSASPSNVLTRIQYFINSITTDGNHTFFDVILNQSGNHYFCGNIYPDKDYGNGYYINVDGTPYTWTRNNGVDTVEQLALNSNIAIKLISASSIDQVKSGLLSAVSSGKSRTIQIYSTFTGNGFEEYHSYYGTLVSESASYFSVNLVDSSGKHLDIGYSNGTWTFNNLSEQIGKYVLGSPVDNINFFGNSTNLLILRFCMNAAGTSYYQLQFNGGSKKLIFTRHDTDGTDTDLVTFTGT